MKQVAALPVLDPVTEPHPKKDIPVKPTTAATEATTQAIERYLADNPGNEPLNALGMTADGRIVRLAEQEEGQRPEMRRVFEHQLGSLMPQIDETNRDRMNQNILSTDVQTLRDYQERIWWDWQIRNRLSVLKTQYADQFAAMNELTNTTFDPLGGIETSGSGVLENDIPWILDFSNVITRTHWKFIHNFKLGNAVANSFFMSNVIVHQFEETFHRNDWPLNLPTIIERCRIKNDQTIDVLRQHKWNYRTNAFRQAFLETTVNGKSTERVAQDLGLTIGCLDVFYNSEPVERIDEEFTIPQASGKFNVQVHVSPDPAVYGSP
ncbi:hypothetical protein [Salinisphaera sp. G21_0]|uniref:hypothetical protein n=1 Tax=Salinisphaera sp. G21_0 TaxID=2821094 RepID=UPI001ADC4D35|nr:hypothetical protein [Salinisphaera sp. G21_0]MBO9483676.1 hypothetical protein [Salinisphaera sp. G21_0]